MTLRRDSLFLLRIFLDLVIIVFSFLVAKCFSLECVDITIAYNEFLLLIGILFTWFISANNIKLYDEFRSRDFSFEIILTLRNIFILAIFTIVFLFFIRDLRFQRIFLFYFIGVLLILLIFEKFSLRKIFDFLRKKGRNLRSVLIIGAGEVGQQFHKIIEDSPHFGYQVLGFLDDNENVNLNGLYIGKIDELPKILEQHRVDNVIVALPNYATERLEEVITTCEQHTTRVRIIPDYFKFISSKYNFTSFGPFPIISVRSDKIDQIQWRIAKRTFDIIFSLLVIILIFPWLFPIIIIAIKTTSQGKVFFIQDRWGRNNKKFRIYKFRTMIAESKDVDDNGNYQQAKLDDPRITKVGKFLRKANIDELPQFFNVLKGDMSVVGPRPHPIPLNLESKDNIRYYMLRHLVKPGITGWAQVNGSRGETKTIEDMQKRVNLDLWYIDNWSIWLDFQIVFLTLWRMITGDEKAY